MTSCSASAHSDPHAFAQAHPQDFSSSAIDDSGVGQDHDHHDTGSHTTLHSPLLFRFSPPDRPGNPLRFIESKPRESSRLRHVTTHAHAHTRRALSRMVAHPLGQDGGGADTPNTCAFSETELLFAPAPFRGRSRRLRRVFDSLSSVGGRSGADDSVEFEVVGVNFEHDGIHNGSSEMADYYYYDDNDNDNDCLWQEAGQQPQPQRQPQSPSQYQYQFENKNGGVCETDEYSTRATANATLFDQQHYHALFRRLQTLELAGHNEEEDDLISPPSPARVKLPFMCSVAVDSAETSSVSSPKSDSSTEDAAADGVFTPSRLSVLPTPLSSCGMSPNPVAREKIEYDFSEATSMLAGHQK